MSKKNQNIGDLQPKIAVSPLKIDRKYITDDQRYTQASLWPDGSEKQAGRSLTITAYLPSLGDRIKRYMKTPTLNADILHDRMLWDDDDYEAIFGEDDRPRVSIHDELYQTGLVKARARYDERLQNEKDERQKALDIANSEFRQRVKEIMSEPTPQPSDV